MKKTRKGGVKAALLAVVFLVMMAIPASSLPNPVNIQGKLTNAQRNALTGTHSFLVGDMA